MATKYLVVLVTAKDNDEAQKISKALLDQRKAGCVNIISGVSSAYWWMDKIESATECLLVIKTSAPQLNTAIDLVKKNHSYTTPEIIALPIVGGNPDYLKWLENTLK